MGRKRRKWGEVCRTHFPLASDMTWVLGQADFFYLLWELANLGFPGGTSRKELACQWRRRKRCGFDPWIRKIPWRRAWQPTSVFLPGESHGHRSLAGYSSWGHTESDMTEATQHACKSWELYFIWWTWWASSPGTSLSGSAEGLLQRGKGGARF